MMAATKVLARVASSQSAVEIDRRRTSSRDHRTVTVD
jgi:hypothetical protein